MTGAPESDTDLPEVKLNISPTRVTAKARKLNTKWSSVAADDLWGMPPKKTPLQDLAEGLDADNFEEWFEEWKKSRRDPRAELTSSMAQEMADEIDREILEAFKPPETKQAAKIGSALRKAIDRAQQGKHSPDLHDEIMRILREPGGRKTLDNGILYADAYQQQPIPPGSWIPT